MRKNTKVAIQIGFFLLMVMLMALMATWCTPAKADRPCTDPHKEGYGGCSTGHQCDCKGMKYGKWGDRDRPDVPTNCRYPEFRCRSYCREDLCSCPTPEDR